MRSNIPSFRLPEEVLDEETRMIIDMGVDVRYNTPVDEPARAARRGLRRRLRGRSAPREARSSMLPGRYDEVESHIFIGIDWLESVAFGHVERDRFDACSSLASATPRWTAVARRGVSVAPTSRSWRAVLASSSRPHPGSSTTPRRRASRSSSTTRPQRFVIDEGRLVGMEFDVLEWDEGASKSTTLDTVIDPLRRRHLGHRPGERLPVDRARPRHRLRRVGHARRRRDDDAVDACPASSSAATRPGGRRTSSGPSPTRTRRQSRSTTAATTSRSPTGRPTGMTLVSQKMGISEWSYHNDYNPSPRQKMSHVELTRRFEQLEPRSRARLLRRADRARGAALPQLRHPDRLQRQLCIECDACIDICPVAVPDDHRQRRRGRPARPAPRAGDESRPGALRLRRRCPRRAGVMVKDENLCVHCGLCAERCPTAAWDMALFDLIDPLRRPIARDCHDARRRSAIGGNGGRSLTIDRPSPSVHEPGQRLRDQARQRQRHRLGEREQPARCRRSSAWASPCRARTSSRRTSRDCRPGTRSASTRRATRRGPLDYDLMVAMNAADLRRGHRRSAPRGLRALRLVLAARPTISRATTSPSSACRSAAMCLEHFDEPRERILMKNIAYAGALVALLAIDVEIVADAPCRDLRAQRGACATRTSSPFASATTTRASNFECPLAVPRRADGRERRRDPHRRQHRDRPSGASTPGRRSPPGTRSRRRPR